MHKILLMVLLFVCNTKLNYCTGKLSPTNKKTSVILEESKGNIKGIKDNIKPDKYKKLKN